MKKVFFTLALMAAAFFCQAQLFVGGGIGLGTTNESTQQKYEDGRTEDYDPIKTLKFTVSPTIGYMFSDNIGAGLSFTYGINRTKVTTEEIDGTSIDKIKKAPEWEVAPFLRVVVADWDPIKLYADVEVSIGGGQEKDVNDGKTTNGTKTFKFGVNVVPGIAYNITDNLSLNAKVNILKLGYNMTKKTTPGIKKEENNTRGKDEYIDKTNEFGFGINELTTPLEVGFFYTF